MSSPDSLLTRLSEADRAALEGRWIVRRYQRDEMIISHDEATRDVFFVLEGRARAAAYSERGRLVAYRDIEAGDILGELAAIDGRERSATVVAVVPVTIGRLSDSAFRALIDERPGLRWVILSHLTSQVRRLTERVYEFSTLVVRKRLVRELLREARAGRKDNQAEINPAPRHFDLAARISTHREAVSRQMSLLSKRKLIERRGTALILLDVKVLAAIGSE